MYKGDLLLVARAGGGGGNNISLLFNLINYLHSSAATKETTGYLATDFAFTTSPIFRYCSVAAQLLPHSHLLTSSLRAHAGIGTSLSCHPQVFSRHRGHALPGHHDHARLCFRWGKGKLRATAAGCRVQDRYSWNNWSEGAKSCAAAAAGFLRGIESTESPKLSTKMSWPPSFRGLSQTPQP